MAPMAGGAGGGGAYPRTSPSTPRQGRALESDAGPTGGGGGGMLGQLVQEDVKSPRGEVRRVTGDAFWKAGVFSRGSGGCVCEREGCGGHTEGAPAG